MTPPFTAGSFSIRGAAAVFGFEIPVPLLLCRIGKTLAFGRKKVYNTIVYKEYARDKPVDHTPTCNSKVVKLGR
jgi:hypothetical protein